jgi:uncharacterized protein
MATTRALQPVHPLRRAVKTVVRFLLALFIVYVGVIIVLMWFENWFIYHPAKFSESWEKPQDPAVQDVWLTSTDGTKLHAWWCPTPNAHWVVLFCHGNAGNVSRWYHSAQEWQTHVGASVLVFDYPGYGQSEGKPTEAGCYAAGEAAYRWLIDENKVSPERLVLHGVSLGGGVAVELAQRHPHGALVLLSAFTNVPDMAQMMFPFLPARWLVKTRFDNLAKLPRQSRPVFIAHGDADELVPHEHGVRLHEACGALHKEFFTTPGGSHNTSATPEYFAGVKRFLQKRDAAGD